MADNQLEANVGKCVDFMKNNGMKQGWKITRVLYHALRMNDNRYELRSNFGAGPETTIILPGNVNDMYDCPAEQNENIEMAEGGRRRRLRRKTTRKTRKSRKSSKKTRHH
jgi:hypothetical protein